ncbi:hypothetical protein N656DRAFT_774443 [Canariomyces notabilis]|uniref:Uncharacterized protein n=1 Tax=Canariomyces notabilis TaxID=2074819 RepID=A0AAN6TKS6_9PEZI|nr:hypothetical protein N656DRAFT_774443 [Canariomyces arenarius]
MTVSSSHETENENDNLLQRCWRQQSCPNCLDTSRCSWCPFVCMPPPPIFSALPTPLWSLNSQPDTQTQSNTIYLPTPQNGTFKPNKDTVLHPKHISLPTPRAGTRRAHLPAVERALGAAHPALWVRRVNRDESECACRCCLDITACGPHIGRCDTLSVG